MQTSATGKTRDDKVIGFHSVRSVAFSTLCGATRGRDNRIPNSYLPQRLLRGGRYDEARGERESACTGRYEVRGNRVEYWDDTGFTADGTFVTEDELHHGGMIFYRVPE